MAYFLPSYFQKRLLRYALTRLDLIETDALNLDDLDITFGQRSVVDLKNVGIKVKKLIDALNLPPTVVLDHALISSLKITVPADLHVSGIVVDVDGVDIQVNIQDEDHKHRKQSKSRSNPQDIANRPRLASTSPHDPGGQTVIPTSQDLAKSFLETEPWTEREELEAALQSQSRIPESTGSLGSAMEENGIGMPGGFSLPSFVANFFAGVADRLSVKISNVQVVAGMHIASDGLPSETVKLMFKLASLSLGGLLPGQSESRFPERSIAFSGFELLLLSEPEAFSQHSTSSSPRLTKSRSKASSAFGSDNLSQFESTESHFTDLGAQSTTNRIDRVSLPRLASESSQSSSSSSAPADLRPGVDESLLGSSQLFARALHNQPRHDESTSRPRSTHANHSIDNAELRMSEPRLGGSVSVSGDRHSMGDLAESTLFSHEQAESLYMSAISDNFGARDMPGGWHSSAGLDESKEIEATSRHFGTVTPVQGIIPTQTANAGSHRAGENLSSTAPRHPELGNATTGTKQFYSPDPAEDSNLVAKRLLKVDLFSLKFPVTTRTTIGLVSPSLTATSMGREPYAIDVSLPDSSVLDEHVLIKPEPHSTFPQYQVNIGELLLSLDMSIGRLLVKATSVIRKLLPSNEPKSKNTQVATTSLTATITVKLLSVNLCQSVPEVRSWSKDFPANQGDRDDKSTLLKLSMTEIRHRIKQRNAGTQQKLTIEKISVHKDNDHVLYFVDSVNVRDSVATSVMLRSHDLVIVNNNDRYEVQLKPVHVVIDLLLVDDVLSRGGGLSSLLDLGNSIMSTGTVKSLSTRPQTTSPRQRSIRFDQPATQSKSEGDTTGPGLKIDVRLSGAFVELIGSETSVQLRTSAIKLVSRQSIFRAQIDNAALLGPLPIDSKQSADINVKLVGLSVIYVDTPAEEDLDRLLVLLTPSGDRYDEEDDIMVDTLIRQRRKGGVMRVSLADVQVGIRGVEWQKHVARLGDELSKLSAVSKYLPEDDRPGVLTFGLVTKLGIKADLGSKFGVMQLNATLLEGAQITVPSLMAAQMSTLSLKRRDDLLLREVVPNQQATTIMGPPMLMCRFIADEMEPTVRVKLSNIQLEYTVPTLSAILELVDALKDSGPPGVPTLSPRSSDVSSSSSELSDFARKVRFSLAVRHSAIALNPDRNPAKGLLLLSDAVLSYSSKHKVSNLYFDLRKGSVLIIDDAGKIGHGAENADHKLYFEENDQIQDLTKAGYVPVGSISNASAIVKVNQDKTSDNPLVDVEFRTNLFLLETCADSTQTLVQILSGLAPPSKPSAQIKFRTEIVPIQDMLASFTGNAFVTEQGPELGLQASQLTATTSASTETEDLDQNETDYDDEEEEEEDDDDDAEERYVDNLYAQEHASEDQDDLTASYLESETTHSTMSDSVHIAPVNPVASDESAMGDSIMAHSMLDFRTDHFARKSSVEGTAHRWDSTRNTYGLGSEGDLRQSPFKLRIRDVHIIWNLFDGYDWQGTRDIISQAVQKLETQAMSRQSQRDNKRSLGAEDDQAVIGDFLFNSIYIGVPATKDPRELTSAINQEIGDLISETGSNTTGTTITAIHPGRSGSTRPVQKRLRLSRSRQHKMTFELKGVCADALAFPPGTGEVETSVDVRIKQLEVFDHVPTSTWKKFATYMHEAGEKELNTNMVHIELLVVKPVADLAASELVLKLTVLPLRLHVDQDALDFMTRFFEFKDDKVSQSNTPSTPPFFQRVEVNPIKLKLDFKPKRVDYGGLRSGRTTEFMNFFVLDRADMVLRRVILYGVSGLDRVGIMLNNIWSPDVRRNQLPGVLAGLAPIRSLVDVGSGVRDLVAVPIREYRKDGRIVRSIQKGAVAFAKTTTTELVNLGAKLAIGTQTVLQNAEEILVPRHHEDDDEETKDQISLYADQPLGIVQGLRGAYASLERDLLLAKDAIVAVPGEVMASGSAAGAAKAVLRQSPTIILRPAIGASKAVGQTLLGAGNTLDKGNLRRVEQKYKRHF